MQLGHVLSLRAFLTLDDFKLYIVTLLKALVTIRLDRAVVHKHIRAVVPADKTEALRVVKPFHFTFNSRHVLAPRSEHNNRGCVPEPLLTIVGFATA